MGAVYNARNKTTFAGATTKSCSVNCSGTHRFAIAHAISDEELPSSVTYGGVAMTLLDSYSNQNGWWIGEYVLQDPATGAQTVLATWPDAQPNCWLGVEVLSSSAAAITVEDYAKNVATALAEFGFVDATCDSTSGQIAVGLAFTFDVGAYGEGYVASLTGSGNTNTAQDGDGNRGVTQGTLAVSGASVAATCLTNNSSGNTTGYAFVVSLTDAGGGGAAAELEGDAAATATATGDLDTGIPLSGAAAGAATASGDIALPGAALEGDAAAESAAAGDLDTGIPLSGSAAAQATATGGLAGDPPEGEVTFDCAVGHDALALRNMSYDGADTGSGGFRLQYAYAINAGSYSAWQDMTLGSYAGFAWSWYLTGQWPFQFNDDGDPFTPGDKISVKMRAANDGGSGLPSDEKTFRLHEDWHRTGTKRYKPSAGVGHAAAMWDVVATNPIQGPLTTAGTDCAVFAGTSVAYGAAGDDPEDALVHTFSYDGVQATKLWSYPSAPASGDTLRDENGGCGGTEGFIITAADGFAVGAKTARFDWVDPTDARSLAFCVQAMSFVHQASPIASFKTRKAPVDYVEVDAPVAGVNIALDATYDDQVENSNYNFHNPDIPASYDELILSYHETYGSIDTDATSGSVANSPGQASSGWTGGGATSPRRLHDHNPMSPTTNLTYHCGAGAGQEDYNGLALWDDGAIPQSMPLHTQRYYYGLIHDWGSITGIAIRPSPNMVHTPSAPIANTSAIGWQCTSECNHGRILVAVTAQSDPEPTGPQVQSQINNASSDYSGTFLLVDAKTLSEGDVAATGGTVTDAAAGVTVGARRLTLVYESQQAFEGGTADLATPVHLNITVTEAAQLEGAAAGQASSSGALTTALPLAGAAVTLTTANGSITTAIQAAGLAVGIVTSDGVLTTQTRLGGAALVEAVATALASTGIPLQGVAELLADANAGLSIQIRFEGEATNEALAAGNLTVASDLMADAVAAAAAAGTVTTGIPIEGAALVVASADGGLDGAIAIEGAAASISAALGSLDASIILRGDAALQALAGADLDAYIRFAGGALAQAAATGALAGTAYTPSPTRTLAIPAEVRVLQVTL